ncbi:MAG: hypothetical protein R3E72_01845 [Steroidobacteraceae bacterium]
MSASILSVPKTPAHARPAGGHHSGDRKEGPGGGFVVADVREARGVVWIPPRKVDTLRIFILFIIQ